MAVAAAENDIEPRKISFKGAKQAVTAFAPKIEAARPEERAGLIDAMLKAVALPPGRRPPGALGAAGAEAEAEAEQAPEPAAPRRQAGAEPREVVLALRGVGNSVERKRPAPRGVGLGVTAPRGRVRARQRPVSPRASQRGGAKDSPLSFARRARRAMPAPARA